MIKNDHEAGWVLELDDGTIIPVCENIIIKGGGQTRRLIELLPDNDHGHRQLVQAVRATVARLTRDYRIKWEKLDLAELRLVLAMLRDVEGKLQRTKRLLPGVM